MKISITPRNVFDFDHVLQSMTSHMKPGVEYCLRGTSHLGCRMAREMAAYVTRKLEENNSPYRLIVLGDKLPLRYKWDYIPVEGDLFMESEKEKWEEQSNVEST